MDNFWSTREQALGIWMLIFFGRMMLSSKMRKSIYRVVQVAFVKKLIVACSVMVIYSILFIYIFTQLSIWKWVYMKEITIWIMLVGIPLAFGAVSMKDSSEYFKSSILSNVKLITLMQFLVSLYSFNIFAELIILPLTTMLFLLETYTANRAEHRQLNKGLNVVLAIIGFLILGLSLHSAIVAYYAVRGGNIEYLDTLIKYCMPIVLSLLYLPISYGFAVYAQYELLFIQMDFRQPDDKKIRRRRHWMVIKKCKLSHKALIHFKEECVRQMYVKMTEEEFQKAISD